MRDAINAWAGGVPAVILVHEPFANLARTQCRALGVEEPMIIVYKQDAPALETDAELDEKARSVAVEVANIFTR